jgi:hypothetical protein
VLPGRVVIHPANEDNYAVMQMPSFNIMQQRNVQWVQIFSKKAFKVLFHQSLL